MSLGFKDLLPLINKLPKEERAKLVNHLAVNDLKEDLKKNRMVAQLLLKDLQKSSQ